MTDLCSNCGRAPIAKRDLCANCYSYERRHSGESRPRRLYDREPPRTYCDNCGAWFDGVRRRRCDACRMYLSRTGSERPLTLQEWQAAISAWSEATLPPDTPAASIRSVMRELRTAVDDLDEMLRIAEQRVVADAVGDVLIRTVQLATLLPLDAGEAMRERMAEHRRHAWGDE